MPKAIGFWVCMLILLVGSAWSLYRAPVGARSPMTLGAGILYFILFGLLGWQVFGAALT